MDYIDTDFGPVKEFTPDKYIEDHDWESLSVHFVSDEITEKYKSKLNWIIIACNWDITPKFYLKYKEYLHEHIWIIKFREANRFLNSDNQPKVTDICV